GWRLVPLEAGADHWTWDAVLARQDVARHDLKLRPHRDVWIGQRDSLITVPCYGWARFLDKNADGGDCRGFVGRVVELKYIFTYTYNGSTFAVAGTPIGVHEGDLEHVTVRVDYDTQSVLEVFFSAHSNAEGRWVPTEKFYSDALLADPETRLALRAPPALQTGLLGSAFAFCGFGRSSSVDVGGAGPLSPGGYKTAAGSSGDGTHPAVYTARCGHASYPRPQRWSRFGGLGDDLAMGDGAVWRPPVVPLPHP
ncbi:unnamed protein product, partial [Phaeothamnion confervicola]